MGPGSTSRLALTSSPSRFTFSRAQLSVMASLTHEQSPASAASTGSIRSLDLSTPTASPTSCHEPICTEKSRVGLTIGLPPSVHRPTFARFPRPCPSQMDFASIPSMKLAGEALYCLLKPASWDESMLLMLIASSSFVAPKRRMGRLASAKLGGLGKQGPSLLEARTLLQPPQYFLDPHTVGCSGLGLVGRPAVHRAP